MGKKQQPTTVVFRKWPNGDVLALFPEVPANTRGNDCQSYAHVGQHSAADPAIVYSTQPASPEEYAELKKELESIGYNLTVRHRITAKMHAARREAQR